MGTSVSFRSPNTPRWQAFRGALETHESVDRVRSELFNAGASWGEDFSNQAIAPFVHGLVHAYDTLEDELGRAVRPEVPVLSIVREARSQAIAAGAPASVAIAERALARTLLGALRQDVPIAESTSQGALETWRANRGRTVAALAQRYLAEVARQFAMHAVSREAATTFPRSQNVGAVRELSRTIGDAAATFATDVRFDEGELRQSPHQAWSAAVRSVFSAGRELPRR
jgi:hypothetical protein